MPTTKNTPKNTSTKTNPKINPLKKNELPNPLPLKKLIGPSFIILGLGLGSGEIILWPYLAAHHGLGIIWGAILGITFQFFMNMEIERYALAHGESIFVGIARKFKWAPIWFLLSTYIPWMWPGIIATSAKLLGTLLGIQNQKILTVVLLFTIGAILSLGPVLYKTVESIQKLFITLGVPAIFTLAIIIAAKADFITLGQGIVGIGDGYRFLPAGIALPSFLAALAYAGAGGNLNLSQSFYVKAKGYGMGEYAGKIKSLLTGKKETIELTGTAFDPTEENISKFKKWWKNVNTEHFLVFWLTGAITICLLALLAYVTTYQKGIETTGVNFVLAEAQQIGLKIAPWAGVLFLTVTGIMLFATQLTVFDSTSRILSENLVLANKKIKGNDISKIYYIVLWLQILSGVAIYSFGINEPFQLITIAAVLNAFAMFIHVGLTLVTNLSLLHKEIRPKFGRIAAMTMAFLFYGGFSIYTIVDKLLN
ncbi:hypothetical protein GF360_01825 [candidate division WWE3 bacterium]|nr:hypothetical protein [candidate division WWE3 bacterium]